MKTKDILISAICTATAILSASCSSDETINNGDGLPKAAIITASLPQSSVTRATGNVWKDYYESIGVRVTAEQNNANCASSCSMANDYKNMKYNVNASTEDGGTTASFSAASDDIIFKEEGEHLFSAYAPYSGTLTNGATIALNTLTGNASLTAQKAIDYIYAEGAKASSVSPQVSFSGDNQFVHKLSKLNLTIKMGEGFSASDISNITSITLGGLKHVGTFDITTGAVAIASDATPSDITLSTITTDNIFTTDATSGTLKCSLYLLPQDCSASALPLSIGYNDKANFTNKSSLTPNLTAGKACNYEITMNKSGLIVSNGTLANWDSADMTGMPGEMGMASPAINLSDISGTYTAKDGDILTGTTSAMIKISDGSEITLYEAIINNQIKCEGDATIHLLSENVVTCSKSNSAGIEAGPADKTLKIDGSGKLTVKGGRDGAGIGSGSKYSCGAITISGGTIVATGGQYGAGIGSGYKGTCGAITISDGTIVATGGQYGAGIGSGAFDSSCGAITISGGTITANGQYGAGIGSGYNNSSCGAITISGGTITATGSQPGAGIGCGYSNSTCGAITINGVNDMRVNSGAYNSACIGKGKASGNVGEIKVTDSTITLDNSGGTNAPYFNPSPTDITGSTFYDKNGNVITL